MTEKSVFSHEGTTLANSHSPADKRSECGSTERVSLESPAAGVKENREVPRKRHVDARHPVFDFYSGRRSIRLEPPPTPVQDDAENGKHVAEERMGAEPPPVFSCLALHLALLPGSTVEAGASQALNDELYSKKISSDTGIELLRTNWDLLLRVLLPVEKRTQVDNSSDINNYASERGEGVEEMMSRSSSIVSSSSSSSSAVKKSGEKQEDHPLLVNETEDEKNAIWCGWSREQLEALQTPDLMDRVHYSYLIFLRFFGWRLHDESRGVVDRHSAFRQRYAVLRAGVTATGAQDNTAVEAEEKGGCPHSSAVKRCYHSFNFYSGLPHILDFLLSLRLFRYAVGLVEFIIEEMQCERLDFLYDMVSTVLMPRLEHCSGVDESHCARLYRKLRSLVESDSE